MMSTAQLGASSTNRHGCVLSPEGARIAVAIRKCSSDFPAAPDTSGLFVSVSKLACSLTVIPSAGKIERRVVGAKFSGQSWPCIRLSQCFDAQGILANGAYELRDRR